MTNSSTPYPTVGIVREVKESEGRVALTPEAVRELTRTGQTVLVETGAGEAASFPDGDYQTAGAHIVDVEEAWGSAIVVKVKEPQPEEFRYLREDLTLFTYLHLAAYPDVAAALVASGTTAFAYETVQKDDGTLPLLAPMSEIAGRLAPQMGAHHLERIRGGRGVLLGGVPGVEPARVVVIGGGNVGWNAARIAAGMEADVVVLDRNLERLRYLDQVKTGRVTTLAADHGTVERVVAEADLVIGAVLVAGDRAPVVVTEEMVRSMKPGSVIVDVAVDQGGCVATTRETSHLYPTYVEHGVVHYAVGNMPGAVPNTSTRALVNATLPYVSELVRNGTERVRAANGPLARGLNTWNKTIVNPDVLKGLAAS